jgi:hypothetical protein
MPQRVDTAAAASPNALPLMNVGTPAGGLPATQAAPAAGPMSALSVDDGSAGPATLVGGATDPAAAPSIAPLPGSDGSTAAASDSGAASSDASGAGVVAMPPLKTDVKGPTTVTQDAWDNVARLRVQLNSAKTDAAAPSAPSAAVTDANAKVLQAQIAGLLSGYVDPSRVNFPPGGSAAAAPVCAAVNAQCGGLQPGSNTDVWRGPTDCCGNGTLTCVQTDPAFAQCVPVSESRARGCSALYARCGGDFWDGPFCCTTNQACIYESRAMSRCAACNNLYAQCGGFENGKPWSKPGCCVSGSYCKQVNSYYFQCVKQGS